MQNAVSNPFFVSCTKDDKSYLRSSTSFPPYLFNQIIPRLENTREKKDKNKKKKSILLQTYRHGHLCYLVEKPSLLSF